MAKHQSKSQEPEQAERQTAVAEISSVEKVQPMQEANGQTPAIAETVKPAAMLRQRTMDVSVNTTIDCTTQENRELVLHIAQGETVPFESMQNTVGNVVHFVAFKDMITDRQTGEMKQILRTHILLDDGKIVATTSPFVYSDLVTYKDFIMGGAWTLPIPFRFEVHRSKVTGGTFHKLRSPIKALNLLGQPREAKQPQA